MIVTLAGSNEFMIEFELKKILKEFVAKHGDMAVEQIDGAEADLQEITDSISGISFLFPNKLIILRRGSSNKQFIDSITQIVENIPENNDLIIVEPNIDKRLSYYKTLKKISDFKMYDELDPGQLSRWIEQKVKENGGNINSSDSRHLIEVAGNNQLRISNEIDKLISYNPKINRVSIDSLIEPIPQTTIFQLLDAAFSGKNQEILNIYEEQKRQKVAPQQVIAMLTWQIHILAMIKAAGNASSAEIASKTKTSPYVIGKSMIIANKMSMNEIKDLTSNLLELDIKLKNQTVDADDALLQLLLTVGN